MPAYIIARVNVTNKEKYQEYMQLTPAAIEKYGGKFIVRGGEKLNLEGPEESARVVVLEFGDMDSAKTFYESAEYQAAKAKREGAAEGSFLLVDGV